MLNILVHCIRYGQVSLKITGNKQIPNNVKQIYAIVYAVSIRSALKDAHLVEIV
jgi:hypothetical protein